jgi:cysteinyl-tRNA synthetase
MTVSAGCLDFALWRPVSLVEGKWDSPWGIGSPGWHIQDTAVTLTNFGPQYDLHGGAYELVYPHHEAEIAQAESITGRQAVCEILDSYGSPDKRGDENVEVRLEM